jgi:sugar lactone lactonase YvrE
MNVRHLTVGSSIVLMLAGALIAMITPSAASASPPSGGPRATLLVTGLEGAIGSTIGPDGALYVTEGTDGRITRVDPQTGDTTTFASGLPKKIVGIGGAIDVAFIGKTAYVLVTIVDSYVGGTDIDGIYRVDGPDSFTVIADIGKFSEKNPPNTPFGLPTGVQYALQTYRGGFLVTDGHHNRVLRVTLDGEVTELIAFDNIVPTGLAVSGNTVYVAEAGPVPHLPEAGKVVAFKPKSPIATEVASGAPLLVDVEFGPHHRLYALSQGDWAGDPEKDEGTPAQPNTGALVEVNRDGTFTVVIDGLDRPTSLEFIGNTAYVVTLTGEIWKIDGISSPPYGSPR